MADVTNYIDRLVAELCPDGVEYRPLGEIADVTSGYVFPVKYQGNEKSAEDNIPFYKVSDMNLPGNEMFMTSSNNYVSAESAKEMRASLAQSESVIFPKIGAAIATNKKRILTEKSIVDNNVMVVTARSVINSKFLYYVLSGFDLMSWSMGAGAVPSIKKSVVVKHEVPIPPMEVQEAIVEILDKFTNLEAELEAELEARTLQYEYYRDSLLNSFSEPAVKFYPIEELFTTRNGYTPSKSNSSYWENGTVPWFRMEDIRENGGVLSESLQSVHESALKKGGMFPAGSIIVATSATIGEHALINVDFLCNQRFTVLTPKEEFKSLLLPKFLYYYSFVLDRWCLANTTQSSFASVDMKRFKKFEFPVPPLEEQQRIVDILDRFDALTSSLSEGLPAELAARRSQYEYYRDQLLTFPRKGENH